MIFREMVPDAVKLETFFEYLPMPSAEAYLRVAFGLTEAHALALASLVWGAA